MSNIHLTSKQKAKIKRAIKSLNDVRKEIQAENPDFDVNWYLEGSGNMNLLEGESHSYADLAMGEPNRDAVIDLFDLHESSGGGW